ncbi:MAG: hypothetical protein ACRDKI_09860 [Solirubrobacterales bacterium]
MGHPPFIRLLGAAEDQRARQLYDELIANIAFRPPEPPVRALERGRVVYEHGGINWADPDHLDALASAAAALGESEVYLAMPGADGMVSEDRWIERAAVDLRALAEFIARTDLIDEASYAATTGAWDVPVTNLLAPAFVSEWTLFSSAGSWIFSTWDAGDVSAMAGSGEFFDAYVAARPGVVTQILEWMVAEGEMLADMTTDGGPRQLLRRNIARKDFVFEGSALNEYLNRFFPENDSDALWQFSRRVRAADEKRPLTSEELQMSRGGGPFSAFDDMLGRRYMNQYLTTDGSPDQRVGRLLAEDAGVAPRLRAIWDGA